MTKWFEVPSWPTLLRCSWTPLHLSCLSTHHWDARCWKVLGQAVSDAPNSPLPHFRYFLRVTVVKRLSDVVKELDIVVHTLSQYPEMNNSIKMEVGIEDCLHIEFEYNKSKWVCSYPDGYAREPRVTVSSLLWYFRYRLQDVIVDKVHFLCWHFRYHLKDVIVGKIYFLLVRIKIKHMEIQIIKRETTGSGETLQTPWRQKHVAIAIVIMAPQKICGAHNTTLRLCVNFFLSRCQHVQWEWNYSKVRNYGWGPSQR